MPDSILARLPKNGGVVMVPFVPGFVSAAVQGGRRRARSGRPPPRASAIRATRAAVRRECDAWRAAHPCAKATIAQVADHIEHVRKVAGVDHVGIGSDFDGITETVVGLEDVSKFPALFAELMRRGWSDADLEEARGRERAARAATGGGACRRGSERRPSPRTATIEQLDRGVKAVP